MGFNAIFSSISAISWRSVLVAEEAGVPGGTRKYKERCLHVNRFQWLSSYKHNFVKKIVENQNPYNMHTFSVGTNCLQNIKGLAQKL